MRYFLTTFLILFSCYGNASLGTKSHSVIEELRTKEAEFILNKVYGDLKKPNDLHTTFTEASKKYDIDQKLLISICYNESRFKAKVISKGGAVGVCQIIPKYNKTTKKEMLDPQKNIHKAAEHINLLYELCGKNNTGCVIQSYNLGYYGYKKGKRNKGYQKKVEKEVTKMNRRVDEIQISKR